jgi:hypothetical protein
MSNVAPSAAGDAKPTVNNEQSNITTSQYAIRRLGELRAKPSAPVTQKQEIDEEPTPKAEPEDKEDFESPDSQEGGEPQNTTDAKGKEVLSQLDLTELSDDDIAELAQKGKSGLLKRIAELTAKRKMAEERMAQMESYIQQQTSKTALEPKVENNPYEHIKTADELGKQSEQVNEVIEWAEDVLDKAETLGYEDIAATVDGKELTKAEVKDHLRRARKARDKYLPAQQKELNAKEQRKSLRSAFENQATKELDWLSSQEDNDVRRQSSNRARPRAGAALRWRRWLARRTATANDRCRHRRRLNLIAAPDHRRQRARDDDGVTRRPSAAADRHRRSARH